MIFFRSVFHQSNAGLSTKFTQPKMATFEDLLTNRRHHDLNFFVSGAKAARRTASSPASPPSDPRIASLRNTYHPSPALISRGLTAAAGTNALSLMRWNEKRIMSLINHIVLNELHGNTIDWINGTFLCVPYI